MLRDLADRGGGDRTFKSEIARAPVFHQKLNQLLMLLLDERSKIRQLLCGGKVLKKIQKVIYLKKVESSRSDRTGGGWIWGAHTAAEAQNRDQACAAVLRG